MIKYKIELRIEDMVMIEILKNEMINRYDDDRFSRLFLNILSQKDNYKIKDDTTTENEVKEK